MLIQRIKQVWTILGCSNKDIAALYDCSESHISKICNGKRELRENGKAALRFSQAVIDYAQQVNRTHYLCNVCDMQQENLHDRSLAAWFFGEGNVISPTLADNPFVQSFRLPSFSEKLNSLMELMDVSNARLSRSLNVDASLVSRYRSGKRVPQGDSQLVDLMCTFFVNRMNTLLCSREVAELTEIAEEVLLTEDAAGALHTWLTDSVSKNDSATHTVDYMRMFLPLTQLPSEELLSKIVEKAVAQREDTYWGTDGMRAAAIRLLSEAAAEGGGELYMYADQSMQWLLENADILKMWYLCCAMCISRNVKIIVIHDVNRKVDDMATAMQVWVPLFMTGVVRPYYCTLNRGSRFSHMLFLRPGVAAISSVQVHGTENNNFYDYITDARKLNALNSEFKTLLSHSEKLIRVFSEDSMFNYYDRLLGGMRNTRQSVALLSEPSTVTMPEHVLRAILARANVEPEKQELVLQSRECTRNVLSRGGSVTELFSLPPIQAVRDGTFKIRFSDSLESSNVCYTYEEYCEHIREIIRLCETQPNFHCCLIVKSPFEGMRMIIMEDRAVVVRLHEPYTAFVVENEFFARAFAKHLLDYYEQHEIPKEKIIAILKKHLED